MNSEQSRHDSLVATVPIPRLRDDVEDRPTMPLAPALTPRPLPSILQREAAARARASRAKPTVALDDLPTTKYDAAVDRPVVPSPAPVRTEERPRVAPSAAPPSVAPVTFGASVTKARTRGAKRRAPRAVRAPLEPPDAVAAPPTFGAGMLRARNRSAKRPLEVPIASPDTAASSTFGASMLRARQRNAKLVVFVILALLAIGGAAAYFATRDSSSASAVPTPHVSNAHGFATSVT
jgi:hypothetical protein